MYYFLLQYGDFGGIDHISSSKIRSKETYKKDLIRNVLIRNELIRNELLHLYTVLAEGSIKHYLDLPLRGGLNEQADYRTFAYVYICAVRYLRGKWNCGNAKKKVIKWIAFPRIYQLSLESF